MKHKTRALAGLLTLVVIASGCLIAHSTSVETRGKSIPPEVQNRIAVGETTLDWLVDRLGQPTARRLVDGREVLTYEAVVTRQREAGFFLLYHGEKTTSTTVISRFEFSDGVLVRHWTE